MMNVLSLVSYKVLPAKTGGQRSISLFNKYLARHVNLFCVTTQANEVTGQEGYQLFPLLSNSALRYANPFYFFTIRRIIRDNNISHLLLEHPYYGWLAVLLKWFCGVKLVVRSQNIEGTRWKTLGKPWWKLLWYYEKWVHRRADLSLFIQPDDLQYALRHFKLLPVRCMVATYGIEWNTAPSLLQHQQARQYLEQQHGILPHQHILLFNGAFNYAPNLHALQRIIRDISPLLQRQQDFSYRILICGKDIPPSLTDQATDPAFIFAGFVPDVGTYFMGADVFINPVIEGGGIKTKLVEALGYNLHAVSTQDGAIGVDPAICGGKLDIVSNEDLAGFVEKIMIAVQDKRPIPPGYFVTFYWENIAARVAAALTAL